MFLLTCFLKKKRQNTGNDTGGYLVTKPVLLRWFSAVLTANSLDAYGKIYTVRPPAWSKAAGQWMFLPGESEEKTGRFSV